MMTLRGLTDHKLFMDVFHLKHWLVDYYLIVSSDVHSCVFAAVNYIKQEEMWPVLVFTKSPRLATPMLHIEMKTDLICM